MKRQLTLPLIRMIFKTVSLAFIFLIAGISSCAAFFPAPPEQLTLFDEQQRQYLSVCPELPISIQRAEQGQLPRHFTLLNWNIYKQKKTRWETQLQEWALTADLITLQEAKHSPDLIAFSKKNHLFYLQNYAFKQSGYIYGVNTLSKVAPLSTCGTRDNEPWIVIPKTGIASTYPIQGSEHDLLLINLHGVNFTFTEGPLLRQLKPYLMLMLNHQGPVIFSGDFNTWSDARLLGVERALLRSGFSPIALENDRRLHVFGLPLDHVYFRGLKALDAQSLVTEASDHNPLLVTFELDK